MKFEFINKCLFFPEKNILVVGDLHIGYDFMVQQSGILIPEVQVKEIKKELLEIINDKKPEKIIFLGDIKHSFAYEKKEKNYFQEIYLFLLKHFKEENIIFIRGNHDTFDYSFQDKLKEYFIEGEIAFLHGDKIFLEVLDKKITTIVIGHLHPSVSFADKHTTRKENYKCFLKGKFKNKEIFVLPSFLSSVEGTPINESSDDFSIIPTKDLQNFEVYVIGNEDNYLFGKVKDI